MAPREILGQRSALLVRLFESLKNDVATEAIIWRTDAACAALNADDFRRLVGNLKTGETTQEQVMHLAAVEN